MACGTRFQANKAWLKPLEEGKDLTATESAVKHDLAISRLRVQRVWGRPLCAQKRTNCSILLTSNVGQKRSG